jgi:hypothetical protein
MIGYLDIPSGISGDMCLGCLVHAGWDVADLRRAIDALGLPAGTWSVDARRVMKGAISATLVEVNAPEGRDHRHLPEIRRIIGGAALPESVRARATAVFERLAAAEARVHGTTPERIHFHEVGALDAIIDIVGVATGLEALGITRLHASAVPLGEGWAPMAHGTLPLPAPATLELLAAAKAPTRPAPGPGELVTPTGAALLAEFATFSQPAIALHRIGLGAGRRDLAWPNIARLWVGEDTAGGGGEYVQIETNIDDMNPQLYAAVCERLFASGARDVWLTPVQMKKGRPGVVLSVIASADGEAAIAGVLLRETTTLGLRVHPLAGRHEARREMRQVDTPYGRVGAKVKWLDGVAIGASPEYEDCARAARERGVPVRVVHEAAAAACQELLTAGSTRAAVPAAGPADDPPSPA